MVATGQSMKLASIHIKNFRSFAEETIIFDDYTCLVGANGAGKSTVLTALNIFFRETANAATDLVNLGEEDFHNRNTTSPVRITLTFSDLSEEATEEFKDYVRLGKLIVSSVAKFDASSGLAQVQHFGQRLGFVAFRGYFEREKAAAAASDLKAFYADELRAAFPDLPAANTKPKMVEALWAYEAAHMGQCTLIESPDQFYGFSKGAGRLEKYLQWVYVPAVKDAASEQSETKASAFGKLLTRRVRSEILIDEPIDKLRIETLTAYEELLDGNKGALDLLSKSLNQRIQKWAHQDAGVMIDWQRDKKSVQIAPPLAELTAIEGQFDGKLGRFGHGLQRCIIIALLEELSEHDNTGPKLLLGIEEPELYQHPPQARYLASLLEKLSTGNAQVVVCTHSPYFVSGRGFNNIRVITKQHKVKASRVSSTSFEDVAKEVSLATGQTPVEAAGMAAKVEQDMQGRLNEIFFASVRVFVEGIEDVAHISTYLTLTNAWDPFRALGCHFIHEDGKSHLIQALAISNGFKLPSFVIFDADGDTPPDTAAKQTGRRTMHENDNTAILKLLKANASVPFPTNTVWGENLVLWPTQIGHIIEQEIGKTELATISEAVRKKYGIYVGGMEKNALFIGYVLTEAWERGKKSASLITLCENIVAYAMSIKAKEIAEELQANVSLPPLPIPTPGIMTISQPCPQETSRLRQRFRFLCVGRSIRRNR